MRRSSWGEQLCPGIVQTRVDVRHDFTSRLQASDGAEIDISKFYAANLVACRSSCHSRARRSRGISSRSRRCLDNTHAPYWRTTVTVVLTGCSQMIATWHRVVAC